MTSLKLFGLALAPLYAAIAKVESDNGDTSPNVYQIDAHAGGTYVDDVNRIIRERSRRLKNSPPRMFTHGDVFCVAQAEYMMAIYWSHWGAHYERSTGQRVTYQVLARIHNGGPLGWKKPETVKYWLKVLAVMEGGRR